MGQTLKISFECSDRAFRRIRPRNVLLQLPSGLKRRSSELAEDLRKRYGCRVIVSGDSCYGACDIIQPGHEIDAIVQLGHAPMRLPKCSVPVIFVPIHIDLNLSELMPGALPSLKSPVGILSTAQHVHQLPEAARILRESGFKVLIGKGDSRLSSPGQILGCDYSSAKQIASQANSFLLLGGGRFHAIGAALSTKKPVTILDPEKKNASVERIDSDAFLRKRFAVIQKLASASSLGILVSTKLGQRRQRLSEELLRISRKHGRTAEIIAIDEVTPCKLDDLGFSAYISTACPRIALDDGPNFDRPIGTPAELLIALGEMEWEEYQIDDWSFSLRRTARRK